MQANYYSNQDLDYRGLHPPSLANFDARGTTYYLALPSQNSVG